MGEYTDIASVAAAANRYQDARWTLVDAVRTAHANGASLRQIARATGIYSHEQIRRLVAGQTLPPPGIGGDPEARPPLDTSPPSSWLCPVCGAVVRDQDLVDRGPRPPLHEHHGHDVELVARAEL